MQLNKLLFLATGMAVTIAGCATVDRPAAAPQPPNVPGLPYHWSAGQAPKAHQDAVVAFGPLALRPGQYRWVANVPTTGQARVVVDLMSQLFYVYRGDRLIGVSTISSGKPGHETPFGYWSVFLKKRMGHSRKYDNAPMPFMQMYDEKGIAFHAGAVPGYPASHGCVRLPLKFAQQLFDVTDVGTKVVVEG